LLTHGFAVAAALADIPHPIFHTTRQTTYMSHLSAARDPQHPMADKILP